MDTDIFATAIEFVTSKRDQEVGHADEALMDFLIGRQHQTLTTCELR